MPFFISRCYAHRGTQQHPVLFMQSPHKLCLSCYLRDLDHVQKIGLAFECLANTEIHSGSSRLLSIVPGPTEATWCALIRVSVSLGATSLVIVRSSLSLHVGLGATLAERGVLVSAETDDVFGGSVELLERR